MSDPGDTSGVSNGVVERTDAASREVSLLSDMVAAGMNPDNPADRTIARVGTAMGIPPDPAKASQATIMSMGSAAAFGALTLLGSIGKNFASRAGRSLFGAQPDGGDEERRRLGGGSREKLGG